MSRAVVEAGQYVVEALRELHLAAAEASANAQTRGDVRLRCRYELLAERAHAIGHAVQLALDAGNGVQGATPAAMAHGCAAPAVGAGAPPASVSVRGHNLPDNPLFDCPEGQDLPCPDSPGDTQFPHEVKHES